MTIKTSLIALSLLSLNAFATPLTIEEARIEKAMKVMPDVMSTFTTDINGFKNKWSKVTKYIDAEKLVTEYSQNMWLKAKRQITQSNSFDDRPLYWTRLLSSKILRETAPSFKVSQSQKTALLDILEQGSRGRTELSYTQGTMKKILLTGFDPFLLDKNINQSNPSGVAALLMDGQIIQYKGITAEINTVMIPVRYKDFDQGIIEALLAPYYALNNVDMIVTVSMGRKEFDLERFPGKRRSVTAPDNLNVLSGGSKTAPIISQLNDRLLPGNEFVEFSLPVQAMQQAIGPYKVIDNNKITTLEKTFKAKNLTELEHQTAVSGSGGGYLSNEISYRSIRLKNQLNSDIPTGHIHTPRIQQFQPEVEKKIIMQISSMLEHSLVAL
jgi:pyrrolidone-carboxylate peptidase